MISENVLEKFAHKNDYHIFKHNAMATVYELFIKHENHAYAEQAAMESFAEIDRLEQELSRYQPNSDISRINKLKQFETVVVGMDCYQCLVQCAEIYQQTKGAFDISAGAVIQLWKNQAAGSTAQSAIIREQLKYSGMPWLRLDNDACRVQLLGESVTLDLGGFGKGYAIDLVRKTLLDWDISAALLNGGMSSVVSLGERWPLQITNPGTGQTFKKKLYLQNLALSGSGIKKGQHIIDTRNGYPVDNKIAAWVSAPATALSDALSTAFMIMDISEIEQYCEENRAISALIIMREKNKQIKFGKFFKGF